MKITKSNDRNSVSLAGEFAVLSQLALRNYDANMTLGRTKSVDILVADPDSGRMFKLEVKTKLRDSKKEFSESKIFGRVVGDWLMSQKHETIDDPSLFYCFVIIWKPRKKETKKSRFFIVPNNVVARYVRNQHRLWLAQKKKPSSKAKETKLREFRIGLKGYKYAVETPLDERYEDNWDFKR
jgi:hypothetical protein